MATENQKCVHRLYNELNELIRVGLGLANGGDIIGSKKETSHFPHPTAEDYRLAESSGPLEGEHALNGSWANILRQLRHSLRAWWLAWDEANAALKALPKQLVDDTTKPLVDRWSGKLSKLLIDVGGAVGSTRPDGAEWEGKLNLSAFVLNSLPDNWREQIDQIATYADELQAIHNAGTLTETATAPPADDGKRLKDQSAIEETELPSSIPIEYQTKPMPFTKAGDILGYCDSKNGRAAAGARVKREVESGFLKCIRAANNGRKHVFDKRQVRK